MLSILCHVWKWWGVLVGLISSVFCVLDFPRCLITNLKHRIQKKLAYKPVAYRGGWYGVFNPPPPEIPKISVKPLIA